MGAFKTNRRRFDRVVVPHQTQLRCWSEDFRGRIRVLGEGGMFIDTIHPRPDGSEMDVVIEAGELIRARCITRNHEPGWGMGVEFIGLREHERSRIRELVSRFL